MGLPQERLPERKDEILTPGARLQITLKERSGMREVEIEGNRKGSWPLQQSALALLNYPLSNCSLPRITTIWTKISGVPKKGQFP